MSTRVVGDYEAYSSKVITLDAVKFTEGADDFFRPGTTPASDEAATAGPDSAGLRCTVSEESLKRVGVDVLQLVACPLVSAEDVKQALAVDPCVASVELDQQLTVDVFGIGSVYEDVEQRPQFSRSERRDGSEGPSSTSHMSSSSGAFRRMTSGENKADRKLQKAPHKRSRSASSEDAIPGNYTFSPESPKEGASNEDGKTSGKDDSSSGTTSRAADAFGTVEISIEDAFTVERIPGPSGHSATTDVSAAVEKFSFLPQHEMRMQAPADISVTDMEPHLAEGDSFDSRSHGSTRAQNNDPAPVPVRGEAAEHEIPRHSLEALTVTEASLPGDTSQGEEFPKHFDVPVSNGEFFFLRALIPSPQQKAGDFSQTTLLGALPQVFSSVAKRSTPLYDGNRLAPAAVRDKADEAGKQEAQVTVPAQVAAAVESSTAGVASPEAEQQRPPSRHVPLQGGRSNELGVSYWRKKSGFHTRAYELASCEKNKVIAVIDTGITYTHPALAPNVWVNKHEIPDNDVDDDGNGYVDDVHGYNFRDGNGDPMDDHGHGTHVAGIIGALENVSEQGLPYAFKRTGLLGEEFEDEMQQELPDQPHEFQGRTQEEAHEEEQQQLRERPQEPDRGDPPQDHSMKQGTQQKYSQQAQTPQRRKRRRRANPWEDEENGWSRKVRAQQGVCGETSIAGLKFMGATGNGATSDAIKALNYAVQMNMKLSCNSWGGPSWSEALVVALEAADESGHLFIAAAGNQGKNTDEIPHYPASYQLPNVISVAATTVDDELAAFSNRGKRTVDVAAPGVKIRSTFPPDGYKELSGTSMATPVVAGLAAMLMSLPYETTKQIKDAIMKGVDKVPAVADLVKSGGRINAEKSVAWLVNELDLDVDAILQRKQIAFRLPPFYALLDDALRYLTLEGGERVDGREYSAREQLSLVRTEPTPAGARAGQKEEKAKMEKPNVGHETWQHKSEEKTRERSETGSRAQIVSENPKKLIKGTEQAEDAAGDARRGKSILRLLKQRCFSNCLPSASI